VDSYNTIVVLLKLYDRNLLIIALYEARDRRSAVEREAALARQL
jgi:hypothetical protein